MNEWQSQTSRLNHHSNHQHVFFAVFILQNPGRHRQYKEPEQHHHRQELGCKTGQFKIDLNVSRSNADNIDKSHYDKGKKGWKQLAPTGLFCCHNNIQFNFISVFQK